MRNCLKLSTGYYINGRIFAVHTANPSSSTAARSSAMYHKGILRLITKLLTSFPFPI